MALTATICLAMAIYYEARGEPFRGKQAVAEVVINRSIDRNLPVCKVVFQPNQFSWTKHTTSPPTIKSQVWKDCLSIAKHSLIVQSNHTNGALYFNTRKMGVRFNNKHKVTIGNHVFF